MPKNSRWVLRDAKRGRIDHATLTSAIQYICAQKSQAVGLKELASFCDLSPAHFHREFKKLTGTTPAKYIERARMTQAAQSIVLSSESILDIALNAGYNNHETFTRAFKRTFEIAPSVYRFVGQHLSAAEPPKAVRGTPAFGAWQVGVTRIQHTRALRTATLRSIGPYETTASELWHKVQQQLADQHVPTGALIGLAHDSPETVNPGALRFDAGVIVLQTDVQIEPPLHEGELPERTWAVTPYSGPFDCLTEAYQTIIHQVLQLENVSIEQGSAMEVYHTHQLSAMQKVNYLEVYIPVVIL